MIKSKLPSERIIDEASRMGQERGFNKLEMSIVTKAIIKSIDQIIKDTEERILKKVDEMIVAKLDKYDIELLDY